MWVRVMFLWLQDALLENIPWKGLGADGEPKTLTSTRMHASLTMYVSHMGEGGLNLILILVWGTTFYGRPNFVTSHYTQDLGLS